MGEGKNNIINLSNHILTEPEKTILQAGLSFVPTTNFDPFTWVKDINLFLRKLRRKKFFANSDRNKCQQLGILPEDFEDVCLLADLAEEGDRNPGEGPFTDLKPRSTKMPPPCDHGIIDAFEKLVVDEIKRINPKNRSANPNISKEERAALQCLQSDASLIIKPSDKGGNTVLMNRVEYVKMCMDILADETTYEVIRRDPSPEYKKSLNDILNRALEAHLISKNELNFLLPKSLVITTFYAIPKIHKGYPPLKGRPIVSGIDALGQNSSIYLDQVLRPFVVALPSYTRDTTDLLTKLDGVSVEAGTILISIDVEALYSSIHHEAGLKAVQYFLNTRGNHLAPHNEFVMTLLEYVLCHNFFLFNGRFYHQLRGTAMGSPCAPTYANLLLGWWEDTVVFGDGDAVWGPHIQFCGRYIDDILVLWTGDIPTFHSFMESLNENQLGLRFTYEVGGREISFLDVKLSIEDNGSIRTTLFRKPTAANGLLRWESYHPTPLKRGIPKGQFLRLRRNCSENGDYQNKARDLKKRFTDRGYPRALLEEANQYAKTIERTTLLHPRKNDDETPRIVVGRAVAACVKEHIEVALRMSILLTRSLRFTLLGSSGIVM
ncbi:unnamed protein product [Ranitomeya imitator]|uniref:Reverse transcriptase domain-containing protein n=1 Tax=Ranitomeya imitator TaxID=111125 RepID=A0ABN9LQ29_9NEOB|nr:unnamed protein product [Ranitomeya imitator]